MQVRETNRPRKTMKILSGTRFQWIAYDTSKKTFIMSGRSSYEFWLDCNQVGIHKTAGIRVWCPAVWGGGTTDKA